MVRLSTPATRLDVMSNHDLNPISPFAGDRAFTVPEHMRTLAMFILSGISAVLAVLVLQGDGLFDDTTVKVIGLVSAIVSALMAWLAAWNNVPDQ